MQPLLHHQRLMASNSHAWTTTFTPCAYKPTCMGRVPPPLTLERSQHGGVLGYASKFVGLYTARYKCRPQNRRVHASALSEEAEEADPLKPEEDAKTSDAVVPAGEAAAVPAAAAAAAAPLASKQWDAKLIILIITCLLLGVCNRITYKAALTPMRNYLFFLAQLTNFGYLITYFTVLTIRYKSGIVTKAMLAIDKTPLILVGACEAIAQVLLMIGASNLPGVLLPIVSQSIMFWNFLFASIVLGARFSTWQILGALGVMSGVVFAGAPPQLLDILTGSSSTQIAVASQVDPFYVAVCVVCFAFPAMATIIKERLFKNAKDQLGVPLDIFVVNSFGSLFQTLFVVALLPFTSGALHGIAFSELPEYLGRGIQCLSGLQPSCGSDCLGAPLLPLIYVAFNLGFNVAMLTLLRRVGTVTTSIIGSCLVPLTVIGFMLPLPFLEPYIVGWNFYLGATLLCMGLGLYNFDKIRSSPNPPPLTAVQGDEAK